MADYWISQPRKFCEFCKCWIADNKPSRDFHEKGKNHQENVKRRIDEVLKKGKEKEAKDKDMADTLQQIEKAAMKALKKDVARDPSMASQYGVKVKQKERPEPSSSTSIPTVENRPVPKSCSKKPKAPVQAWKEEWTPEGFVYYWNTVTSERMWEKPEGYVPTWERAVKEQTDADDLELEEVKPGDTSDSADLTGQGHTQSDQSSQGHTATEESQPKEAESQPPSQKTADSEHSRVVGGQSEAGGAWKEQQTEGGPVYYWNTVTGETSWEKPGNSTSASSEQQKTDVPVVGSSVTSNLDDKSDDNKSLTNKPSPPDTDTDDVKTDSSETEKPAPDVSSIPDMIPDVSSMPDMIPDVSEIPLPGCEIPKPPTPPTAEPTPVTEDTTPSEERQDSNHGNRLPNPSVYGTWQSAEPFIQAPPVDFQLPVDETPIVEVHTVPLSSEPKIKFREKKVDTLGAEFVAFKKRKLNNRKDNMRKAHTEKQK